MKIKVNSGRLSLWVLPIVGTFVTCGTGFAADGKSPGPSEALFLIQIIVPVFVGRLPGEAV